MNEISAIAGVVIKELVRRKDFYVLFVLTALITLIMGSVNLFHDTRISRYLKEICLLLIWICSLVIAITTTARQIPMERESRTIFPLLAKPVTRTQLILGKFLGCWLACAIALAAFYLFFGVVAMSREHHRPLANYFQAMSLHWAMLGVVIAMTLLGSLVFSAPSANTTICFIVVAFILLLGRHLDQVAMQVPEPGAVFCRGYSSPFHIWSFSICATWWSMIGRPSVGLYAGRPSPTPSLTVRSSSPLPASCSAVSRSTE